MSGEAGRPTNSATSEWTYRTLQPAGGPDGRLSGVIEVGRADCEIVLDDPEVSRRHAALRATEDGRLLVEDLGSTNGTWVNGDRIDSLRELHAGNEVRFGDTVWQLVGPADVTRVAGVPEPVQATALSPAAAVTESAEVESHQSSRGDVPALEGPAPSAISRLPPELAETPFEPPAGGGPRRSAARRLDATLIAYSVVAADAIALALYFAAR